MQLSQLELLLDRLLAVEHGGVNDARNCAGSRRSGGGWVDGWWGSSVGVSSIKERTGSEHRRRSVAAGAPAPHARMHTRSPLPPQQRPQAGAGACRQAGTHR